jgi:hypothetical protein
MGGVFGLSLTAILEQSCKKSGLNLAEIGELEKKSEVPKILKNQETFHNIETFRKFKQQKEQSLSEGWAVAEKTRVFVDELSRVIEKDWEDICQNQELFSDLENFVLRILKNFSELQDFFSRLNVEMQIQVNAIISPVTGSSMFSTEELVEISNWLILTWGERCKQVGGIYQEGTKQMTEIYAKFYKQKNTRFV